MKSAARDLRAPYRSTVKTVDLDVSSQASVRTGAGAVQGLVRDGEAAPSQALMLRAGAQFMGRMEHSVDGYHTSSRML